MTTIVQYWHSEEIPDDIAAAVATFRDHNPEMPHLMFNEATAGSLIAEHFSSREVAAFRACAVPAMQSDYLRYCAIFHHGGIYADADIRCTAPLSSLLGPGEEGILFGRPRLLPKWQTPQLQRRERVGSHQVVKSDFFAFRAAHHPLPGMALAGATANIENRIAGDVGTVTGPGILTSLYLLRGLGSFDAFLDYADGTPIEGSAPLLCETIGNYREVENAFEGVRMPRDRDSRAWVKPMSPPPRYKKTEHWIAARSNIYR